MSNKELIQVSITSHGAYFIYPVLVTRGIRGKTKGKVGEVIIVGIPLKKIQDYCLKNNLVITNKAVYINDLDHPILFRKGDGLLFVKENEL